MLERSICILVRHAVYVLGVLELGGNLGVPDEYTRRDGGSMTADQGNGTTLRELQLKEADWVYQDMEDFVRLVQRYRGLFITVVFAAVGWCRRLNPRRRRSANRRPTEPRAGRGPAPRSLRAQARIWLFPLHRPSRGSLVSVAHGDDADPGSAGPIGETTTGRVVSGHTPRRVSEPQLPVQGR